ncbi:MAG: thermonuclease family protein [Armatimonadota bacterium]|nr:thermonuclease family protein [Armatimonadota bacterium]
MSPLLRLIAAVLTGTLIAGCPPGEDATAPPPAPEIEHADDEAPPRPAAVEPRQVSADEGPPGGGSRPPATDAETAAAPQPEAESEEQRQPNSGEALCTRVIDGDTIELADGEHVRYIGIDTPEMRPVEAWAEAATRANRELVEGKILRLVLDVEERDRYGRLLAYVYVDDTFVNAELVRRGLAQVVTYPPNVRHQDELLRLQRQAREAGRGLWSDADDG